MTPYPIEERSFIKEAHREKEKKRVKERELKERQRKEMLRTWRRKRKEKLEEARKYHEMSKIVKIVAKSRSGRAIKRPKVFEASFKEGVEWYRDQSAIEESKYNEAKREKEVREAEERKVAAERKKRKELERKLAAEKARAKVHTVKLVSTPTGALVFLGGMEVGKTPYSMKLNLNDPDRTVILKLAGYEDREVKIKAKPLVEARIERLPSELTKKAAPKPVAPKASTSHKKKPTKKLDWGM